MFLAFLVCLNSKWWSSLVVFCCNTLQVQKNQGCRLLGRGEKLCKVRRRPQRHDAALKIALPTLQRLDFLVFCITTLLWHSATS